MATEEAAGREAPRYPIESVNNVLRLVLMLRKQPQIRLTEASAALGVAPSTAHRLLAMLEHHDFVRNDEDLRAYVVGRALSEIGLAVVRKIDIRRIARPVMQNLQKITHETLHLAALDRDGVFYLAAIESDRALRVASRVGRTLPAHTTSVGKVLLAEMDEERILALYPGEQLPASTEQSIRSRTALLKELVEVRKVGYATNRAESEDGVGSVAVAIPGGEVGGRLMALSVAAPLARFDAETERTLVPLLTDAVGSIAAAVRERQHRRTVASP
jgi:DNA-binding IclR family transcriptional regulator